MDTLTKKELPPVDEPVMVTYDNCESLGYLDDRGIWHEWYSDKELKNVTDWALLG